ncbi:MAG: ribose 5-phosphate isomerase B [Oscillospiraceae bacterium]
MIAIGCDHGGFEMKTALIKHLQENNVEFVDLGCNGETVDYPDIAVKVCEKVTSGECDKGVLVCGTGIGMSMAANKIKGIRAAVCGDTFSAKFTRLHNNCNVLCMGGRVIGNGLACDILDIYLATEFEGGRHERRVEKIMELEGK